MVNFAGATLKSPLQVKSLTASTSLKKTTLDQSKGRAWEFQRRDDFEAQTHPANVYVYGAPKSGVLPEHLLRFIYRRILLTLNQIRLGNITSAQSQYIGVWNANFYTSQLTSIEIDNASGITLTGQPIPPLNLKALEEKQWAISIPADGPAIVDTTVTFHFADGTSLPVHITGNRITVWSLAANWDQGIVERLEWLTSAQTSPLGVEQRRSLRLSPRRTFQVNAIAHDRERQLVDLATFSWGARAWAIPIWNFVQRINYPVQGGDTEIVCDTNYLDFVPGGMAMLRGKDAFTYEIVQIEEVLPDRITLSSPTQNSWPSRTLLYPARAARLTEQPVFTRLTDRTATVTASFRLEENSDWEAALPTETYRGVPVFSLPPEESESLTATYQRLLEIVDTSTDRPIQYDSAGLGFSATSHRWQALGRAAQAQMRSFFYGLKGRWKSVWLPTHSEDLTIVGSAIQPTAVIDVANLSYTRFGIDQPGRRDIRIMMKNGNVYMRRILDAVLTDEGNERLSLDDTIPAYTADQVLRVSFMALCRMDQDYVEINHVTDSAGEADIKTTWRSLRDDV